MATRRVSGPGFRSGIAGDGCDEEEGSEADDEDKEHQRCLDRTRARESLRVEEIVKTNHSAFIRKSGVLLFVGNLPFKVSIRWLLVTFQQFGNVIDVSIPGKLSRGFGWKYGFVRFGNDCEAEKAINGMDGCIIGWGLSENLLSDTLNSMAREGGPNTSYRGVPSHFDGKSASRKGITVLRDQTDANRSCGDLNHDTGKSGPRKRISGTIMVSDWELCAALALVRDGLSVQGQPVRINHVQAGNALSQNSSISHMLGDMAYGGGNSESSHMSERSKSEEDAVVVSLSTGVKLKPAGSVSKIGAGSESAHMANDSMFQSKSIGVGSEYSLMSERSKSEDNALVVSLNCGAKLKPAGGVSKIVSTDDSMFQSKPDGAGSVTKDLLGSDREPGEFSEGCSKIVIQGNHKITSKLDVGDHRAVYERNIQLYNADSNGKEEGHVLLLNADSKVAVGIWSDRVVVSEAEHSGDEQVKVYGVLEKEVSNGDKLEAGPGSTVIHISNSNEGVHNSSSAAGYDHGLSGNDVSCSSQIVEYNKEIVIPDKFSEMSGSFNISKARFYALCNRLIEVIDEILDMSSIMGIRFSFEAQKRIKDVMTSRQTKALSLIMDTW